MSKDNQKNSDAFKLEVVGLSEEEARSLAEIAKLLGIKPKKLARWHALYGHDGEEKYPGNVITRLEKEVRELRAENDRLRLDNKLMNEALSFASAGLNTTPGSRGQ